MMTHKTLPATLESRCWTDIVHKSGGTGTTGVTPCPMKVPARDDYQGMLEAMINERSLGGCPPPTDETGTSKLRQGALVLDTVFDNGT